MKLYSWLRALLIFMVMSAGFMNVIPPQHPAGMRAAIRW